MALEAITVPLPMHPISIRIIVSSKTSHSTRNSAKKILPKSGTSIVFPTDLQGSVLPSESTSEQSTPAVGRMSFLLQ
jgi:hypothetical protein